MDSGRRNTNGCGVTSCVRSSWVSSSSWWFDVGPASITRIEERFALSMKLPASLAIVAVTSIRSPGSKVPSPSWFPASTTDRIAVFTPLKCRLSFSGWRWSSSGEINEPEKWQLMHRVSSDCGGMIASLDRYEKFQRTSSWHEPQASRDICE